MYSLEDLSKDQLTGRVIGAAMEVHRLLGPGLMESVYESCLCHEMEERGIVFKRQQYLPLQYKTLSLPQALRIDILVEGQLIVELKAIDQIQKIHEVQLLTYLRLSGLERGLILNFNVTLLKEGIRRVRNFFSSTDPDTPEP